MCKIPKCKLQSFPSFSSTKSELNQYRRKLALMTKDSIENDPITDLDIKLLASLNEIG